MFNKILVSLDGSESCEEVLTLVRILAKVGKSEIILLRVVEYPSSLYSPCYEYPPSDPDIAKTIIKLKEDYSHRVGAYLERIVSSMEDAGINTTAEVCDGPVVESILACASRLQAELIILSAYGQSGGTQGMIGAVANRVLCESQVPVILVRPSSSTFIHNPYKGLSEASQIGLA